MRAEREAPRAPASQGSPRRFTTVQMRPVEVPPPSGRMLDDALSFDIDIDAGGALELDCLPSSHGTRVEQPRQTWHDAPPASRPTPMARTLSSRGMTPPPSGPSRSPSSSSFKAVDTHAAFVAFAGFGDVPAGIFGTPAYAWRVMRRRRALKADLARARLRRSPDVGLYEASLRVADRGALRTGLVAWALLLTLGVLLVGAAAYVVAGPLLSLR